MFCILFRGDILLEDHPLDMEFLSFFFVLCIEFLICGILSFNFISFYKESALSNFFLVIIIDIFLVYMILLIFLNSSNYSTDILSITKFIHNENIMDCYTDKNKLYLFFSIIFDFIGTIFFNFVTYLIFSIFIK